MQPIDSARNYDAEVASMLRIATAIGDLQSIHKLSDHTCGIAGLPGVMIVATTGEEDRDADT